MLSKYRVVYLGVLEPLAATTCLSRFGSRLQQRQRVCAKVFDKSATLQPPETFRLLRPAEIGF